jgi:hypothetical protein
LGSGLWRRLYDDCATAARRATSLQPLLPQVYALAEAGQQRWPSAGLDVPADSAGRAHYAVLREVDQSFREVAYRSRLAAVSERTDTQRRLGDEALQRARSLLTDR